VLITSLFTVRDSTIAVGDNRITGLTPGWLFLKTLAAGSSVTTPGISEIGNGQYKFSFDAEANGECSGQIDAGASLASGSDRYIDVILTRDSSRIQSGISSAGIVEATDTSGNALATAAAVAALASEVTGSGAGPIAINQNTGGADNLRYVNSNGQGIGDANILIYLATDWPGNPGNVQAAAVTGPDGRWLAPAFVSHGTYVAVFTRIGLDGPDVSAPFTV
jgi:hypothetical protein